MNEILISYIIPVYNAEKYIEKCVRSITCQTNAAIEIILVDDGSRDASGRICDMLAQEDARIYVIHQKNKGHGEARNVGISAAKGEWLCFVDDDDWLDKNTQEFCLPYFQNDTDVILFGKKDIYQNRIKEHLLAIEQRDMEFSRNADLLALQNSVLDYSYKCPFKFGELTLGVPWGKYIRASLFETKDCRFVAGYGEDRPCLFLIFQMARKVVYINKALYNYRIHNSTMRKYLPDAGERYQNAILKMHEIVSRYLTGENGAEFEKSLYAYDIANFSYFVMQDYCNIDNPKKYKIRKKDFLKNRNKEIFDRAFREGDIKGLPLRRKCLALLIKYKLFWCIYIMSKMNRIFERLYYTHFE